MFVKSLLLVYTKDLSFISIPCYRFRAELACHQRRAGGKRKANDGSHSCWWQAAEQKEEIRRGGDHRHNPVPRPGHPLHDLRVRRLLRPRSLLRRLQILVLFKLYFSVSLFLLNIIEKIDNFYYLLSIVNLFVFYFLLIIS